MGLVTSAAAVNTQDRQNVYTAMSQPEKTGESFRSVYQSVVQGAPESMDTIFEEAASRYGVPLNLVKAVAKAESDFNPNVVSKAGAIGVMQLMPGTARSLGVTDPYDARQNIMGGTKYLRENLDRFGGNVSLALAAYNAGPNSVQKYGGIPPYQETQNYVKKVTSYMNGSPIYAGKMVSTNGSSLASLGGSYGLTSDQILSLYGTSAGSVGGLYGTSANSLYGLASGSSYNSQLGSFYGTSYNQLAGLYGMSSGSTDALGLMGTVSEDGDTITIDKASYASLIQILRLQMMMNASREVGTITL